MIILSTDSGMAGLKVLSGEVDRFGIIVKILSGITWTTILRGNNAILLLWILYMLQDSELTAQKQLKEEAETVMQQFMTLVQYTAVSRSSSVPPNTRDALYQGQPPSIKSALRSKLLPFQVKEEFTVSTNQS